MSKKFLLYLQIQDLMKLVQKRAKQLYEIDCVLFSKIELPVLIPDIILESQKALSKKNAIPKKRYPF